VKRPRFPSSRFVALVAASLVVAATASVAFARGGGGGNFGGGGRGGGGGGGDGGDGIGFIIWLLLRLCFEYPLVGIPLLILFIVIVIKRGASLRNDYQGRVLRRGREAGDSRSAGEWIERIQERDPAFDPAEFDARVRAAFVTVQNAWCAQDLTAIRAFVSDGVYERFSMQIDEEKALGYRDRMDALNVSASRVVHVGFEGAYDAVVVRVTASAADYRVSLATGDRVSGSTDPEFFAEFWTFLRRRGAKSRVGAKGLMEGNCPNCGDALDGNQFADCKSCHARLRSGEHDWVLVEITQDGEWAPPSARALSGVEELVAADPGFCVEELEDRSSVAFWRWATAMRVGDAKPLAGVASDEVVRAVASSVATSGGARRYVGECGVGGVELIGVARDDGVHHALVEVTWSGTEFESRAGAAPRRLDRTGVRSWLFVYERSAAAKTRIADSFSSAHCRGCGAPAEGASTVCAFCGETLVDVNAGWTLARMTTRFDAAGRVLLERLRASPGAAAPPPVPSLVPAGVLAWAARVAASDGVVDGKERAGLALLAQRAGVAPSRVDEIVRDALASGGDAEVAPPTPQAAREWLEFAARIALADGVVSDAESALLLRLAASAEMSSADVRVLVNRVRAEMYQEAKVEIARAKRGAA
jgi:hypothetical protein